MRATREAVSNVVKYGAVSRLDPRRPPAISREGVGTLISTPRYDKAMKRVAERGDRLLSKVNDLSRQVAAEEATIEDARFKTRGYVDRSSEYAVRSYNEQVLRLNTAIDRRKLLLDRRKAAAEDARERLTDLEEAAKEKIDDDIVGALQKLLDIAQRFGGDAGASKQLTGLEICLIALKLDAALAEHIETSSARREAKQIKVDTGNLFVEFCENADLRTGVSEAWQQSIELRSNNLEIRDRISSVLAELDPQEFTSRVDALSHAVEQQVDTDILYAGLVEPNELEQADRRAQAAEAAAAERRVELEKLYESAAPWSEEAARTAEVANTLAASMRAAFESTGEFAVGHESFLSQLFVEDFIEELLARDQRQAVAALRAHVAAIVGENQLTELESVRQDRWSLSVSSKAIESRGLGRIAGLRAQVPAALSAIDEAAQRLDEIRARIREQPEENATEFEGRIRGAHARCLFPLFGFFAAFENNRMIRELDTVLSSDLEVYRALGARLLKIHQNSLQVVPASGVVVGLLAAGGTYLWTQSVELGSPALLALGAGVLFLAPYLVAMQILKGGKRQLEASRAEADEDGQA